MKAQCNIDLNDDIINFCKQVTGIDDMQEAVEHFCASCIFNYINPEDIFKNLKGPIMK